MKFALSTCAVIGALLTFPSNSDAQTPASSRSTTKQTPPAQAQRVQLTVTEDGFVTEGPVPSLVAGRPVTLVVTRKADVTCATELVIREYGINQPLPLGEVVEITFTPKRAGTVRYSCSMDMIGGELKVSPGGSNAR